MASAPAQQAVVATHASPFPRAPPTLGIRREDKSKWERRTPLTPDAVRQLVQMGYKVLVQPSSNRIFRDTEYAAAGAVISESLAECTIIFAVKEVPIRLLVPGVSYCFFSHTIKAQAANMPLLDALLKNRIRLYDYETITVNGERGGKRLVAFGRFAGLAGVIDWFSGCGARFLSLGHSTPFLAVGQTFMYPDLGKALAAVRDVGDAVAAHGLPEALTPLTLAITGDGNVAHGAREVVEALGPVVQWVQPGELAGIVKTATGKARTHTIYACMVTSQHMVRLKGSASDGTTAAPFDKGHYKSHPDAYEPTFHDTIAPYLSLLAVCHYWEPRFPRLLTVGQVQSMAGNGTLRLLGVTDISADFMGSLEFGREFRPIEAPFYCYDPVQDEVLHDLDAPAPAILYHCVDHLPSECAREASLHFSSCLLPLIPAMAGASLEVPVEEDASLPAEVRGAAITDGGRLTKGFDYIAQLRAAREKAEAATATRRAKEATPAASPRVAAAAGPVAGDGGPGAVPAANLLHIAAPLASPVSSTVGPGQPGSIASSAGARSSSFLSLHVAGHLFDSGWVNAGLDLCEGLGVDVAITSVAVGRDRTTPTRMSLVLAARRSGMLGGGGPVDVTAGSTTSPDNLARAVEQLKALAATKNVVLSVDTDEQAAAASGALAVAAGVMTPAAAAASLGLELDMPSRGEDGHGHGHGHGQHPLFPTFGLGGGLGMGYSGASHGGGGGGGGLILSSETSRMPRPTSHPSLPPPEVSLTPQASSVLRRSRSGQGLDGQTPALGLGMTPAVQPAMGIPATGPTGPVKRVLMLGAGLVAGPALATLLKRPGTAITVASVLPSEASGLVARFGQGKRGPGSSVSTAVLDAANDTAGLAEAVSKHDVVLSLLPAPLHPAVAKACLASRAHMVTASYVSPALAALSEAAVSAGVVILNEMGLDPGIDHISAASMVHAIQARGGTVTHFTSVCGGLPAPQDAMDNPIGYKFSWSPRGALVAMQNDAQYLQEGKTVVVQGGDMLASAKPIRLGPGFALEVLPNRDSLPYADKYGLSGPGLRGMFRGTLRYEGFARRMAVLGRMGLLAPGPVPMPAGLGAAGTAAPVTWRALTFALLGVPASASDDEVEGAVAKLLVGPSASLAPAEAVAFLRWAGLLDGTKAVTLIHGPGSSDQWLPVDTLAGHLSSLPSMSFRPGEVDLALLHHEVKARLPDGSVETHTATLAAYGDDKATAMSRTVGITAAIGVELVLDGALGAGVGGLGPGVHTPVHPAVFKPALARLEQEGIHVKESVHAAQ